MPAYTGNHREQRCRGGCARQDRPVSHEAAVRLYDVLADRLRQYAAVCGDGNAEARGDARTKTEALLPSDGWLGRLLAPTQGKVIGVEDVAGLFPPR
jgi:hypothetical protein